MSETRTLAILSISNDLLSESRTLTRPATTTNYNYSLDLGSYMHNHIKRSFSSLLFLALASTAACSGSSSDTVDAGAVGTVDATDVETDPSLANWCQAPDSDFSFFVTSMDGLWVLSDSTPGDLSGGFGGNFGGMSGADGICQSLGTAAGSTKTWHAFLSATDDGNGNVVNAIERIGSGPWNDANGRLVANNIAGLLSGDRPDGDAQSVDDLPDECGVGGTTLGDVHDTVTASNDQGMLFSTDLNATCNDWTSSSDSVGTSSSGNRDNALMCGHSFPRSASSGRKWISDHPIPGCGKGAVITQGMNNNTCIGCSGGYGALYCFAM